MIEHTLSLKYFEIIIKVEDHSSHTDEVTLTVLRNTVPDFIDTISISRSFSLVYMHNDRTDGFSVFSLYFSKNTKTMKTKMSSAHSEKLVARMLEGIKEIDNMIARIETLTTSADERATSLVRYFTEHDNTPLYFPSFEQHVYAREISAKKDNATYTRIDQIVRTTLAYTLETASFVKGSAFKRGGLQCSAGCLRSSGDLWRHIISVDDKITLEEVMRSLVKLVDLGDLYTHYCSDVLKRVFTSDLEAWDSSPSFQHVDEYGFTYNVWRLI